MSSGDKVGAGVGVVVLTVVIGGTYHITDDPGLARTSTLAAIFDSRLLVASARVLVFAAVLYLLASIVVRVVRGEWVRGVAQVQTDAPAQELADDQEDLQQQLEEARTTIDDLRERLARSLGESADRD